jgi:hypothetical protein
MVVLAAVRLDVAAALAQSAGSQIALLPPEPSVDVHWIVFVDDLHLDFRTTGRLRDLPRAVARELVREDDAVTVVSSGPSRVQVRAARGPRALLDASRRLTGNGLKDDDIVAAGRRMPNEVDYRVRSSLEAAVAVLDGSRTSPWSRRRVMLYLSRGYAIEPDRDRQESGAALLEDVMAAAGAADVVVVALEPAGQHVLPPFPSPVVPRAVQRQRDLRQASLTRLAETSGGFVAVDAEAFRPDLLARINALVGR